MESVINHPGGLYDLNVDVRLAQKGNTIAFERLITDNKTSLYRVAKGILTDEADISDAIQETILKAYKGLPKLRNHAYFKTWLIKILINECNTILRYQKRIVPIAEVKQNSTAHEQPENEAELMNVIGCLEKGLKIVTILYYYEDLPIKTIASIVNVPEGTIKSRLSRARNKLYCLLMEEQEEVQK